MPLLPSCLTHAEARPIPGPPVRALAAPQIALARLGHAVLAFLALGFCAPPAEATVAPPVSVEWSGALPSPAVASRSFEGLFELRAPFGGLVENLRLEGDGWSVLSFPGPRMRNMAPGETEVFSFRAVPTDPTAPLRVQFTFDGVPVQETFRLDAKSLSRHQTPGRVAYAEDDAPRLQGLGARNLRDQNIHFQGSFRTIRGDGASVGVDAIVVKIMDEDDFSDEEIWSGTTDTNGNFVADVSWDDCDISGCDDPDIYVEFITNDGNIDVHDDDFLQTTYSWRSATVDDFTGNNVNFGLMLPGDPAEYGAAHVYTGAVRARRHAFEVTGVNTPLVEIFWPDPDGTNYTSADQDIRITSAETWIEATVIHEFGHHFHNSVGTLESPNYINGFCDPGHCVWCPENNTDSWNEGWADWFGGHVVRTYPTRYGITAQSANDARYMLESPLGCGDGNTYNSTTTEGFVGMLLRDIDDSTNDDHDGGPADCDTDALAIGDDEIFTVIRDDDPANVTAFVSSFRARWPQYDQDLWSTARNVGATFGFPLPTPQVVSDPDDCNVLTYGDALQLQVSGNGSLLKYQWKRDGVNVTNDANVQGATTPTLTISFLLPGYAGTYRCLVSTCDATLSVLSSPVRVGLAGTAPQSPLVSWGENWSYQGGNGTQNSPLPPLMHLNLPDVVAADGGRSTTYALRSDGTVWSWGQEQLGELGDGIPYIGSVTAPAQIPGLVDVVQVAAHRSACLVLQRDGTVKGWGANYGTFGDGTIENRAAPVTANVSGCVMALAAGDYFGMILLGDGTVLTAGDNSAGQLGGGTFGGPLRSIYASVPGLSNVTAIAAGAQTAYALKADGTVWAWGDNVGGLLGNGDNSFADQSSPVQVTALPPVTKIYATPLNAYVVTTTGSVYGWGSNANGAIGIGSTSQSSYVTPTHIPTINNPRRIDGGASFNMALLQDGTLRAWGFNGNAEFGAPTPLFSPLPIPVAGVASVTGFGVGWATVHAFGVVSGTTGVESVATSSPTTFALHAPAPNPFRSETALSFDLVSSGLTRLQLYDVSGRRVRSLLDDHREAGTHRVTWDGRDDLGQAVVAGLYFARLEGANDSVTQRVIRIP